MTNNPDVLTPAGRKEYPAVWLGEQPSPDTGTLDDFYFLLRQIESLGCGEEFTKAVVMASDLRARLRRDLRPSPAPAGRNEGERERTLREVASLYCEFCEAGHPIEKWNTTRPEAQWSHETERGSKWCRVQKIQDLIASLAPRADAPREEQAEQLKAEIDDVIREHMPCPDLMGLETWERHVNETSRASVALLARRGRAREDEPDIEAISAEVHAAWMEQKRAAGVTSRKLESGEELMVPYGQLSEAAKELDRATVRAVLAAMQLASSAPPRASQGEEVSLPLADAAWLLKLAEFGHDISKGEALPQVMRDADTDVLERLREQLAGREIL